jgi:hypothetical protein
MKFILRTWPKSSSWNDMIQMSWGFAILDWYSNLTHFLTWSESWSLACSWSDED